MIMYSDQPTTRRQKDSTMTLRSLVWTLILINSVRSCLSANDEQIFKVEAPIARDQNDSSIMDYDDREEAVVPLLTRDMTLLHQTIETMTYGPCRDQCQLVLESINNMTDWAMKFYDASGKFPVGVLAGSMYQLGNFDECLDIGVGDNAPPGIRGKYCLAEIHVRPPETWMDRNGSMWSAFKKVKDRSQLTLNRLYWGICVPVSCNSRAIDAVIRRAFRMAFADSQLKVIPQISEETCYKDDPLVVDTSDIIYLCAVLSVMLCIISGTLFHVIHLRNKTELPNGTLSQALLAFSFISNLKKVLSPAHDHDLHLDCISGIKFFAMVFIIAGHTLVFILGGPLYNKKFLDKAVVDVANSIFLNNPLLVDTFLFLSGFLFCRILLRELDKRKSVNFLLLYIGRYLRLTPAYLLMIGLYITWLPKIGSGPLWSRMELEKEKCLSSWWVNLLYINNYANTDKICMFQSWYLSVDTQLFVLAPIVIYPLWRWQKFGEYFLIAVTSVSVLIPFAITLIDNLDPTLMIYVREIKDVTTNEYFSTQYIKTHMRAEAYCFGLIYGYIVYRIHTSQYKLSRKTVVIGWISGVLALSVSMCSIVLFYGPRKEFSAIEASLYSTLHRVLWTCGTGWVLIACITDNSGPIRNVLRWRPFVALSRLTYSAYLLNGLIEIYTASTVRTPQHLSHFHVISVIASHCVITFGGAILLSTMFESPILGLEKILLRSEKKPTDKNAREPERL